jgi:hypothetical protein
MMACLAAGHHRQAVPQDLAASASRCIGRCFDEENRPMSKWLPGPGGLASPGTVMSAPAPAAFRPRTAGYVRAPLGERIGTTIWLGGEAHGSNGLRLARVVKWPVAFLLLAFGLAACAVYPSRYAYGDGYYAPRGGYYAPGDYTYDRPYRYRYDEERRRYRDRDRHSERPRPAPPPRRGFDSVEDKLRYGYGYDR